MAFTETSTPVRVYPFHGSYPNQPELFHVACTLHEDAAFCGTQEQAIAHATEHVAAHHLAGQLTTPEQLASAPVGSVVLAHWEDDSQPDHHVVRSGAPSGGAASNRWTIANEKQWAALLGWGATLTVFSTPAV